MQIIFTFSMKAQTKRRIMNAGSQCRSTGMTRESSEMTQLTSLPIVST
ncbi:hypothetical protein [Wolbachia endosymbiont (group A) of Cheilosia soror]|nr:hypothetical protein [Wolbachia endosymbiont (group A) of Cheilosia soror]